LHGIYNTGNSDDKDMTAEREAVRKAVEYLPKTSHTNSDPYDIALIALAKLTAKEDASWEIERYIG